jgi:hypothetical protein
MMSGGCAQFLVHLLLMSEDSPSRRAAPESRRVHTLYTQPPYPRIAIREGVGRFGHFDFILG